MNITSNDSNNKPIALAVGAPIANYKTLKGSEYFFNDGNGRLIRNFNGSWKEIKPTKAAEYSAVMETLDSQSKANVSTNAMKDLIFKLKADLDLTIDTDVRNTGRILFNNGVYDSEKQDIIAPSATNYMWATVNCNYVKDAKINQARAFSRFLHSSLDYENDKQKADLLLEIIGYAVSDYTCAKAAFNLIGPPSCGKSVILEMIKGLIPDDQTTQINFSHISNRFSTGLLRDSRINLSSEISEAEFPNISDFKSITACDSVMGENKCEHGFMYRPRVTLINAGNVMCIPKKVDGTDSVIDRLIFLVFEKSIPQGNWNPNLVEDLLAEKDIIVSVAVDRLLNLKCNNWKK